jgi:hypothetical protein
MMIQGVSINEMISQSMTVLTKPGIATFEQYERRGGQREAMTYVSVAAAIGAIVALVFGVVTAGVVPGIIGAVVAFLLPVISFWISATLTHWIGTQQGGTGSKDEVFYTLGLFMAPILAINGAVGAIPILGCLALPLTLALGIYQIYLGYLAVRSSLNLDQNKAIITMVLVFVAQVVISMIVGFIVAALGFGAASVAPVTPPTP